MDRREIIRKAKEKGLPARALTSRLLILSPTAAFEGKEDIGFEIVERVAVFFQVSVRAVHACGSAKLGFSPVTNLPFREAESDLDLAVIDADCFLRYVSLVLEETDQYRNLTGFSRDAHGQSKYFSFIKYLAKGIFRPDMMPVGNARRQWFGFFNAISTDYMAIFSKVSAGIYLSDESFNMKQTDGITRLWAEGGTL